MIITQIRDRLKQQKYINSRIIRQVTDPKKDKKIKISIITGQLATGGVERVLLSMIQGLSKDKFDTTIYVTDFSNNTWIDKFQSHATVIHITKILDWSTDQNLITNYLSTSITARNSDVIFITNSETGYRSLPRIHQSFMLRRRKLRVYDLLHTHGTSAENDAFLRISQPFDRYITKRIVISQYLKTYFCKKYPVEQDKVLVIPNGLPAEKIHAKSEQREGREILALHESERAITFVGRLQSDKSPERLVELARIAKGELKKHNAFIAVVGEGSMREELESLAAKYKLLGSVIRFYGLTDKPAAVMAASYFTILTSNLEGVPMSILESMDQGTPVIAPSVGGITEIVPDSSGILIDFTNCSNEGEKMLNLKHGLVTALTLDKTTLQSMKNAAKITIDKNFKHMEQDYIQLFEHGRLVK